MSERLNKIVTYQRQYWGESLYACIMAVADVSDLSNDELDALEEEMCNGYVYSEAVSCSPQLGEVEGVIRGVY